MNKSTLVGLCLFALSGAVVTPAFAEDPKCLDCHEPAEDWAGMTVDQIMAQAKNPNNKRHADNMALSDEQLKAIIAKLLPPK
jgi:hypothetical protein